MSETPVVTTSIEDRVMTVTVNRPDKLNALNREVIALLTGAIRHAGARKDVGAVVLTGAGERAFVAGADIEEMSAMSPVQARRFAREGQALGAACDLIGKPVIAAVEGFALGGGCELAAACHLRVAGPRARFGQPEVNLGLIPGFGGTQRLARIVGEGRALELILTGSMIDAKTALSWGFVNRIAEGSALDAGRTLAAEILEKGPVAVGLAIDAVRNGASLPLEQALEYEASLFAVTFSTEDMTEGTSAFLEKRSPGFRGR